MTGHDGHRAEPHSRCGSDRERTEHDVTNDDAAVGDQRQRGGAVVTKRVNDAAFVVLTESLAIHLANGRDVAWLLITDFNHGFVLRSQFAREPSHHVERELSVLHAGH